MMTSLFKAAAKPVASPDFRISQHVDYFPLREGLQPVLPLSALVEWTGSGTPPPGVSVAEYVQNSNLSSPVLEREFDADWKGHGISWERDGRLYPGTYLWRIVLHDDAGKVIASADQKVAVGVPPNTSLALSSLVLGTACRDDAFNPGSMQRRVDLTPEQRDRAHLLIDPMKAADCRVKPSATARFLAADSLHAFVRIYPTGKLGKNQPETWTATYTLRSSSGAVEFQRNTPFTVDSGSGYLASLTIPLGTSGIERGLHTLEVHVHGPGIRKDLTASRSMAISAR